MASLYPLMMLVGWILARTRSFARFNSSAAKMTTLVVPSPTSWSCRSASSTKICKQQQPTAKQGRHVVRIPRQKVWHVGTAV
jgi:hypothetical protein